MFDTTHSRRNRFRVSPIAQSLGSVQNVSIGISRGKLLGGLDSCSCRHDAVSVDVNLRNDNSAGLTGNGRSCLYLLRGFVRIGV